MMALVRACKEYVRCEGRIKRNVLVRKHWKGQVNLERTPMTLMVRGAPYLRQLMWQELFRFRPSSYMRSSVVFCFACIRGVHVD